MRVGEYKLHVSEKVRMYMNQTNDICESVVIRPSVTQERVSEALERDDCVILLDGFDKALVGTFLMRTVMLSRYMPKSCALPLL